MAVDRDNSGRGNLSDMDLFIAWDGDHIGRKVGMLSLADDEEGLRRVSQAIDAGNQIWRSWVELSLGSIISYGGDEGRARVPADKISELERVAAEYASCVKASVSVGVGVKLSQADRALLAAKIRGGDQVLLYTPELEKDIDKLREMTEKEKLSDEYMGKAERSSSGSAFRAAFRHRTNGNVVESGTFHDLLALPDADDHNSYEEGFIDGADQFWSRADVARGHPKDPLKKADEEKPDKEPETTAPQNNASAGGGFASRHEPGTGGEGEEPAAPTMQEGSHSQGEQMQALADNTSPVEGTHAAGDFEDELHAHAQEQDGKDEDAKQQGDERAEARKQVVQILQQVKQIAPQMEQMKEQAPDIYEAVFNLVQALIITGRGLLDPEQQEGDGQAAGDQQAEQAPQDDGSAQQPQEVSKSESEPSLTRCMDCKTVPRYEAKWAEGKAHVWFCAKHWDEWKTKHVGDIDLVRLLSSGKASEKWGDAPGEKLAKGWPKTHTENVDNMENDAVLRDTYLGGRPGAKAGVSNAPDAGGKGAGVQNTLPLVAHKIKGTTTTTAFPVQPCPLCNKPATSQVAHMESEHPEEWAARLRNGPFPSAMSPGETVPGDPVVPQVRDNPRVNVSHNTAATPQVVSNEQLVPGKETKVGYARAYAIDQDQRHGPAMATPVPGRHRADPGQSGESDPYGHTRHSENINWQNVQNEAMNAAHPLPSYDTPDFPITSQWAGGNNGEPYYISSGARHAGQTWQSSGDMWELDQNTGRVNLTHSTSGHMAPHRGAVEQMLNDWMAKNPQAWSREAPLPVQKDEGHATAKPHIELPVGASKDGKVKVRHEDGKAGWVSVRSGQVLSNDGHAVSSRNPGGR